jgi:periplasmic copper chaperone A
MRRTLAALGILLLATTATTGVAAAHTESDVVAVPAGEEATVTLEPTHGCGDSPTVEVRIRAEVPDATPQDVDGWTASAEPDGDDRTVVTWTGGSLPADATGEFPLDFTAPDTPGELLLFPAIQRCADGEELAWIDGDPESEYPAPRLLILPAGSSPATSIDDVPADAPGRDQLVAIVDVDNPNVEEEPEPTTTTASTTTTTAETEADPAAAEGDADEDGVDLGWILAFVLLLAAVGAGAVLILRSRSAGPGAASDDGDSSAPADGGDAG